MLRYNLYSLTGLSVGRGVVLAFRGPSGSRLATGLLDVSGAGFGAPLIFGFGGVSARSSVVGCCFSLGRPVGSALRVSGTEVLGVIGVPCDLCGAMGVLLCSDN
jgi:hypothetical protein